MIINDSLELSFKFVIKLVRFQFLCLADVLQFVLKEDVELSVHVFHHVESLIFVVVMVSHDADKDIFDHRVELELPDVREIFRLLKQVFILWVLLIFRGHRLSVSTFPI